MTYPLSPSDRIEIHTLQDNYIDLVGEGGSDMIRRPSPIKDGVINNSISAEHGFSALISISRGSELRKLLFDFGYSEHGAAQNADALDLDLKDVECLVLSHGHSDHTGGIEQLCHRIGKKNIPLVFHPVAFRTPRYVKPFENMRFNFPAFTEERLKEAGIRPIASANPHLLIDDTVLFLGEVPRKSPFEKGMANVYYEIDGEEKPDPIEDDTAIVLNLNKKGLVILSGCAHSGIINTVKYAKEQAGEEKVHAIMGGFHLTGPNADELIALTIEALMDIAPDYIIPTHCTGRIAIQRIEEAMPDKFLLNMSGTKIIFR